MAKSIFNIGAHWFSQRQSIKEISYELWETLVGLSKVDELFKNPVLSEEGHQDVFIDLKLNNEDGIKLIAHTIIEFSRKDILANEGVQSPTIEFSRDFGFMFVLSYNSKEKNEVSFIPRMGSSQANGIGTVTISRQLTKDFNWYYSVLRALIDNSSAKFGSVSLKEVAFNEICNTYNYPLGWITFFSNDYKIKIPDDLKGVEYEKAKNGTYLISTREDFTTSKETYEAHKQKLLEIMGEIKRRVPEYSK